MAAELGLSETVFVDDAGAGSIRIFTPAAELDFAGHPTVGTAWLLARERAARRRPAAARGRGAGALLGRRDLRRRPPGVGPAVRVRRLESPAGWRRSTGPPGGPDTSPRGPTPTRPAGIVRARVFPLAIGIAEDEATGSAAVQLAAQLGREIEIRQGRGSRILARPAGDGRAEIGGRSVLDEVRDY